MSKEYILTTTHVETCRPVLIKLLPYVKNERTARDVRLLISILGKVKGITTVELTNSQLALLKDVREAAEDFTPENSQLRLL